ncbi:MAG TPA: SCO family protein [Streptosporangiaceae bacterium]|nr:SCO family protein [Streptosporangiaceae bacterium]
MNSGLSDTNATVVAAFRSALLHQGIIVLAVLAALALAWVSLREWLPATARARLAQPGTGYAEPAGRRLLRIGFGVIWVFDGLLQAQPAMAAGMPSQVIEPAAAPSPSWVQHLINWAGTSWSYHPIQAGAAAVWIQVGIGAWLLAAPRGWTSRLAGLASVGWGLVVWVFGEAFGGIFAPGSTLLFGTPGAVLFYCAAGVLIALPEERWRSRRLGRQVLAVLGLYLIGMAVLQAWPGRGFWQGVTRGQQGSLVAMVKSMATTPQPHWLASLLSAFATFDSAHGAAVNLVVVVVLAVVGTALLSGRPELIRPAFWLGGAFALAVWVLAQDLGFLGGLGTDPNSMIPLSLLAGGGYLAMQHVPEPVPVVAADRAATEPATTGQAPARLAGAFAAASMRAVFALWAAVIVLIGAAPMAMAQANRNADPIIAEAIDGNAAPLNFPAPAFTLTDQYGRQVSLASLRGKVVLLTFLDPVCTSDCPQIAQEFRGADQVLGSKAADVELVAIVANPIYRSLAYTRAFDAQERLSGLKNWLYLTGSLAQLQQAWKDYAIAAYVLPAGGMIAHSDVAYVIGPNGHTREELDFDPGPGTTSSISSFAVLLTNDAKQYAR